ncbi:MAG: MFS transporter [Candidatus Micrarchaeaceae archaeon]
MGSGSEEKAFTVLHAQRGFIPRHVPGIAWYALIVAWLSYVSQIFIREVLFATEPVIGKAYNLNAFILLALPGIYTMLYAVLAVPVTRHTDRLGGGYNRRTATIIFMGLYALVSALVAFKTISYEFSTFLIILVAGGIIVGPAEPLVVAMAGDWFPMEHRGFAIGLHHTGYPWGSLIGGAVVSEILTIFGTVNWRLTFLLVAIPTIILLWVMLFAITKENQERLTKRATERGLHVTMSSEVLPEEIEALKGKRKLALSSLFKNPTQVMMLWDGFWLTGTYWVWAGWLPLYLFYVLHYSAAATAILSVIFAITGGIGQILWGTISDRLGRKFSLLVTTVWFASGVAVIMLLAPIGRTPLIIAELYAGLGTNATYPLIYSLGYDVADKKFKGVSMGFIEAAFYLGGALLFVTGALLTVGGGLTAATGYTYVAIFMIVVLLMSALLTFVFARESKGWYYKHDWSVFPRARSNISEEGIPLRGEKK